MTKNQKGIALLTVLWILMILMVIVFSFSFLTRTETQATLSFKEGIENKFLAEAGIERGLMELFYRIRYFTATPLLEGYEIWETDGRPYSGSFGDGTYTVKIFDESGKVNINYAPEILLKNLINNLGVDGEALDTIVDSIMDWKDPDDFHRLHGAESDYYRSLPNPYNAKNANFDTPEELLMVKGVTRELLFGSGQKKGLIDFLTVHGKTGQINLNAAPKEVLMAIPGIDSVTADLILTYRLTKMINNEAELTAIIGKNLSSIVPYTFKASNVFTLESVGSGKKLRSGWAIRSTVTLEGDNQYKVLYYKSPVALKKDEPISK